MVDGQPVEERRFTRRKATLLVKLLALQPHHQIHRDQAMETLWPDLDSELAANNLHKTIHLARLALEPALATAADSHFILTESQRILLRAPGNLYIDVEAFEQQATRATRSEDARECEAALSLYAGDLLIEDLYDGWLDSRREQLRENYHVLLLKLSRLYEQQGLYQQSIERLKALVARDIAHEEAHRDLMRLYALTGSRRRAIRQYKLCAEAIRNEMDCEPDQATMELYRQIESGQIHPVSSVTSAAHRTSDQEAIETIAILPLDNAGADPNVEYLSDGITEGIIKSLSQLPGLRVMAWSTVSRYKSRKVDPQEVGRELKVSAVLGGRVLQLSDSLVVKIELVDAKDGSHLWGEQYNRRLADAFAVEGEISSAISEKLRLRLTGDEKQRLARRHTENTEAYHAYLKGRYYWNKRATEWLKKGVENFRLAIDLDPSFASAYSGLSDSYTLLVVREAISPEEGYPKAKAAAAMALKIDEALAEAHASLGHARLHNWEWEAAEKDLKRAIELNPGYPSAHHWLSEHLTAMGRCDESIAELRLAAELDPLSLIINADLGRAFYYARRYDEVIKQEARTLEMDPNFWLSHINLGRSYTQKGMHAEAIRELKHASELSANNTESLSFLAFAYSAAGKRGEALRLLRRLSRQAKRGYVPPYHLAIVHAGLGEKEQAFDCLELAFEKHSVDLFTQKVEPLFDCLREDRRFLDLLVRIGLL
jgi:DNA-binding SARP family transcriptional activator